MLEVTNVKVTKVESGSRVKAVATITIDNCFVVHNIKVLEDKYKGLFIVMPSQRLPDGSFKDIAHPINTQTRNSIQDIILEEYSNVLEEYSR